VQQLRQYDVQWKFISLKFLNEDKMDYSKMPEGYKDVHAAGTNGLRVAARARAEQGNEACGAVYTALGTSLHKNQEREKFVADPVGHIASLLSADGLPAVWAESALDDSFDALIREETELALERTGKDVGTPILTFHPGAAKEASFFGPVIAEIPRGDAALKLWDAVETVATTSGMAELKRSLRSRPNFN
jgi:hypothetical protein